MKKEIGYARLEVWWGIVLIVEINIKVLVKQQLSLRPAFQLLWYSFK